MDAQRWQQVRAEFDALVELEAAEWTLRLVERLLTVAETCKKQKRDLLGYLTEDITAYRLGQVAPALLPCL